MKTRHATKKTKKVIVTWSEVITYTSNYVCPSCHTAYVGVVRRNTIRFLCDCGQELIVVPIEKVLAEND